MADPKLPPGFTLKSKPQGAPPAGFKMKGPQSAGPALPPSITMPVRPFRPRAETSEGPSGGTASVMGEAARGLTEQMLAGLQGTSPVVQSAWDQEKGWGHGDVRYQKLGEMIESDTGFDAYRAAPGKMEYIDPRKHVILTDPETGKYSVYLRTPETDEGLASSLGRIVGLGGVTGPLTRLPGTVGSKVGRAAEAIKTFNAARVPPTPAAVGGRGAKFVQNWAKDFFPTAGPVSRATQRSTEATGAKIGELAGKYGAATTVEGGGQALLKGGQEFVTKFRQKAEELYSAVDRAIPQSTSVTMAETMKRIAGDPAAATARAMRGIASPFDDAGLNALFSDPLVKKIAGRISENGGQLSWNDAKMLRSKVGELLDKPAVMQDFDRAQVSALYGALSDDMGAVAQAVGAGRTWERANGFWRAGRERIDSALKEVLKPGQSGEAAFATLYKSAQEGTRGNIQKLIALQRSMPAEEWGDVASVVLRELGKPVASQSGMDEVFSASTFLTRYGKLSDDAKTVLFNRAGQPDLRQALDTLVKTAGYQKAVEQTANTSRTAGIAAVGAMGAGLVMDPVSTILTTLGANLGARAVMNPKFIRWLAGTSETTRKTLLPKIATLSQMARLDPALREFAAALQPLARADETASSPATPTIPPLGPR